MILIQPDIVKSSLLSRAQEEFTVHWGKRALFPGEICTYQSQKWEARTKLPGKYPKSSPAAPLVTCPSDSLCCMSNLPQRNSFGNKSLPAAVTCLMVASACKRFDMSVSPEGSARPLNASARGHLWQTLFPGKWIQSKDSLCKWGNKKFWRLHNIGVKGRVFSVPQHQNGLGLVYCQQTQINSPLAEPRPK